VDNITIIKRHADLPGDFSGGLVQISTEIPDQNFISVKFGGVTTPFLHSNLISPTREEKRIGSALMTARVHCPMLFHRMPNFLRSVTRDKLQQEKHY
jgi:hypothetical protein